MNGNISLYLQRIEWDEKVLMNRKQSSYIYFNESSWKQSEKPSRRFSKDNWLGTEKSPRRQWTIFT